MWASRNIGRPRVARVYDYLLGGSYSFEADRSTAQRVIDVVPHAPSMARMNRAFVGRVVRYYLTAGITQFLDLGSGLPSRGNVHELAQKHSPETRVLYIDIDPVAVMHYQLVLKDNKHAAAIYADLREPDSVLNASITSRTLNLDAPIGVLMTSVLQFISDREDPAGIIANYHSQLAVGSYLALSHPGDNDEMRRGSAVYEEERLAKQVTPRSRTEIRSLLAGLELVTPGVTWLEDWRPDPSQDSFRLPPAKFMHGAVIHKKRDLSVSSRSMEIRQ